MASGRILKTQISLSEQVNDLSLASALLFTWMIPHADDFGRMHGGARRIKALVVPMRDDFTAAITEECLREIASKKLIQRYEINGEFYIQFPSWESHQSGLHKRTKSKIPEYIEDMPREIPGNSGKFLPEEKGTEQEIELEQEQEKPHTPTTVPNSKQERFEPTPAARVCRELRNLGFGETNPAHPLLLELLAAGATVDEFVFAGKESKKKGKDFKYLLGIVRGQRAEALAASKQILHGDVPNKSPPKTTPQRENFHEKDYGEIRSL